MAEVKVEIDEGEDGLVTADTTRFGVSDDRGVGLDAENKADVEYKVDGGFDVSAELVIGIEDELGVELVLSVELEVDVKAEDELMDGSAVDFVPVGNSDVWSDCAWSKRAFHHLSV